MDKAKVYFIPAATPESVLKLYRLLGPLPAEKLAVKLHSGEEGNQNFMKPEFWKPVIDEAGGTVVECNTAYPGERNSTPKHKALIRRRGWDTVFPFDLMDAEGPDMILPVEGGLILKENRVGKHLANYDSLLVLSHFKGHPAGGYGGALKQLSIGIASTAGKALIHSAGYTDDQSLCWSHMAGDRFLECMADAAKSVVDYFGGRARYINVMKNLSVDCDCCDVAEDPCMADIGVLASLDPIAIDQACMDLIYASDDPGRDHFLERVHSRHGEHTLEAAAKLGFGTREYELIRVE